MQGYDNMQLSLSCPPPVKSIITIFQAPLNPLIFLDSAKSTTWVKHQLKLVKKDNIDFYEAKQ